MKEVKPPITIDDYIALFPVSLQEKLEMIRMTIRKAAPGALEKISYQMPTYWQRGNLVHFAAHANHIGFYPEPSAIIAFKKELAGYHTSKGAVQFPLDKALPVDLIRRMVKFRIKENLRKAKSK